MEFTLTKQLSVSNQLGEGILWDSLTESFWWADILGCKLYRYSPTADDLKSWTTPQRLCSFALLERATSTEPELLAAFADGIALYKPLTDEVEWLSDVEKHNPGSRLNDGRTDTQGRFWVGGVVEDEGQSNGQTALYQIDSNLTVTQRLTGLTISNGLCFSPDGNYLYHTDTPSRTIHRYRISDDGSLNEKYQFAKTDNGCMPDGSITDSYGNLYNAEWGGGKVRCYSPQGDVKRDISLPVSQVTCVAFGGSDLSLLAVTTAAVGVDEVGAGDLFIFTSHTTGVEQTRFKLGNCIDIKSGSN